jgi:hypothetical protein
MIMIDQSKRLSEPLRWTRVGRVAVVAVLACLVLATAGLGLHSLLEGDPTGERARCVSVTFPSTLGAASVNGCGEQARKLCAAPSSDPGIAGPLREQCRREGFPVSG